MLIQDGEIQAHVGISYSSEKGYTATICHNLDEFHRHNVKQKSDIKQFIIWNSFIKNSKTSLR